MPLTTISLWVGIIAVLGTGMWRCASLLFRIAVAVEATRAVVPELAAAVKQLDHRTTRLEAERGVAT